MTSVPVANLDALYVDITQMQKIIPRMFLMCHDAMRATSDINPERVPETSQEFPHGFPKEDPP